MLSLGSIGYLYLYLCAGVSHSASTPANIANIANMVASS